MGFKWFWQTSDSKLEKVKDEIIAAIKTINIQDKTAPAPLVETIVSNDENEYDAEKTPDFYDGEDDDYSYDPETVPFSKVILSNNTLTAITKDGNLYTNVKADKEMYKKALKATSEQELKRILMPEIDERELEDAQKRKQQFLFKKEFDKLVNHADFTQKGESLYMKGISLSLPVVMVKAFNEVVDRPEEYAALKNFWYWLALNPNPESIEDAYKFIEHNDIKITPKGQLILYRRIVSKGKQELKSLIAFVSTNYAKVKMRKKSTKNYYVAESKTEGYRIVEAGKTYRDDEELLGSLYELYNNLPQQQSNDYTAWHDNNMKIKIGSIYSIEEEKVDRNNRVACSSGLHVASKNYDYSGFGDTPVMCLVNPSKIRAVPAAEAGKMRVSEMFVVAVLEIDAAGTYMDDDVNIVDLDEEYFNIGVEELEKMAKEVNIKELAEHKLLPQVGFDSFNFITSKLKEEISGRVVDYKQLT